MQSFSPSNQDANSLPSSSSLRTRFLRILGLLILFVSACGVKVEYQATPTASPASETVVSVAATITTSPATPTAVKATTAAVEATAGPSSAPSTSTSPPTAEPTPTVTPTPLPTNTPTPSPPIVTLEEKLNVRTGPGTNYTRIGLLEAGVTVGILGRNSDTSWWQIVYPEAASGIGWISADYGRAQNTVNVPVVEIPPTPTPATPSPTPTPTTPPVDFVVKSVRLWSNEENGGVSPGGSVTNCGYEHHIIITVLDAAGNLLDGVVLEDTYKTLRQITGSRGPGRAEYIFWGNGYRLLVIEDQSAGRPVTSETSPLMSPKDEEIPVPWLMEAHYCATEAECIERASKNLLCRGHYSYDLVFQRTW